MKFKVHFKGVALDAEPLRDLQRLEVRSEASVFFVSGRRILVRKLSVKGLRISLFFRIFAVAIEMLITLIIHLKKHTIMNKTWKTILKVISYVIAAILGAAGEASMM